MKKTALIIVTLTLFFQTSVAQNYELTEKVIQKIDSILTADYKANEPGAVALIAQNGKSLFSKGYGMAHLEFEIAMKPEYKFHIGSITKQFTAVGILILHEQGRLSIKDDIRKFVPELNTHGEVITIENLLTMTSGIPGADEIQGFELFYKSDIDEYAALNFIKDRPLLFKPGTNWGYSNTSYTLAGLIIERASKAVYKDFITKNIFEPLAMNQTQFGSTQVLNNKATGYQRTSKGFDVDDDPTMWARLTFSGAIISTAEDLLKWHQGLKEGKLIQKALLDKAYTSYILNDGVKTNYGYGWIIRETDHDKIIYHGGNVRGFHSYEAYLPKSDCYVVVLSNEASSKATRSGQKIINLINGIPTAPAKRPDNLKLNSTELTGVYESLIAGGRIQSNITKAPRFYSVFEEDGKLFIKRTATPKVELIPVTPSSFISKNNPELSINFIGDNTGKVIGLKYGSDIKVSKKLSSTVTKNPPIIPIDSMSLLPYTGIFKAVHFSNRDYFIQQNGKLWLKDNKDSNPQELAFIGNDTFVLTSDHERTFKFTRDNKGKVIKVEQKTFIYDLDMMRWDVIN